MEAARGGHTHTVEALIGRGADVNAQDWVSCCILLEYMQTHVCAPCLVHPAPSFISHSCSVTDGQVFRRTCGWMDGGREGGSEKGGWGKVGE